MDFKLIRFILILLLSAVLLACASSSKSIPKFRYYKVLPDQVIWVERNTL